MADRLWARVDVPTEAVDRLAYRAWSGAPGEQQARLPTPGVLVIDEQPEGIFLRAYAPDGHFAGDTWHRDLDEALGQAAFAYGEHLGPWREIPPAIEDPAAFALRQRQPEAADAR